MSDSEDDNDFGYTLVEYCGEHSGYRCGYCQTNTSNYSHGLWAHKMTCSIYQTLIDRGWRRSGKYCYKPAMDKTCCPQYTIRCDVQNFKLSRSQKKVLKRVHSFLNIGSNKWESKESEGAEPISDMCEEYAQPRKFTPKDIPSNISISKCNSIENKKENQPNCQTLDVRHDSKNKDKVLGKGTSTSHSSLARNSSAELKEVKAGIGPDPSKPVCKKAKLLRREKYEAKRSGSSSKTPSKDFKSNKAKNPNEPKPLEDFINAPLTDLPAHKLEVRLVPVDSYNEEYIDTFDVSHSVYKKYQSAIHGDPETKSTKSKYQRFLCNSPIQLRLVPVSSKDGEIFRTFKSSFEVFRNYQMTIHKDPPSDCDEPSYKNFLVDGPLTLSKSSHGPPKGYGSFHQQYWLDGELIAVGVLDILPDCVSSVYFYYDSKYSFLSLGTYSSLREIALARELSRITNRKVWYYMGFYIHSCPKMRYKGQYYPSFLLCPETYKWTPIEKCLPKLEIAKYSRFNDTPIQEEVTNIGMILCLFKGTVCRFQELPKNVSDDTDVEELKKYLRLVGNKAAGTIILYRD